MDYDTHHTHRDRSRQIERIDESVLARLALDYETRTGEEK